MPDHTELAQQVVDKWPEWKRQVFEPKQTRDLDADFAICVAAAPGPWYSAEDHSGVWCYAEGIKRWLCDAVGDDQTDIQFMQFIAAAREGWPYAIRRALEAEAEVDRLRNELQIYQDQDRGSRGPWD